jgi:hypothetical protein
VIGPLVDVVTALAFMVGVAALLAAVWFRRTALMLLAGFAYAGFVLGALVPYQYPTHTRTFLLVPLYAIIAALGLEAVTRRLPARRGAVALSIGLAVLVWTANLHHFFVLAKPWSGQSLVARIAFLLDDDPDLTLCLARDETELQNLRMVLEVNGFAEDRLVATPVPLGADGTPVWRQAEPPFVILIPGDDERLGVWTRALDDDAVIHSVKPVWNHSEQFLFHEVRVTTPESLRDRGAPARDDAGRSG